MSEQLLVLQHVEHEHPGLLQKAAEEQSSRFFGNFMEIVRAAA